MNAAAVPAAKAAQVASTRRNDPKRSASIPTMGQRQGALTSQSPVSDRSAENLELSFRKTLAKTATPRRTQRTERRKEQCKRPAHRCAQAKAPKKGFHSRDAKCVVACKPTYRAA